MLKNKLIALLVSAGMCLACAPSMADGQAFEVLTSFYPMYLLTVHVAGGLDGVNVNNMAEGLIEQDPAHADAYRKNADAYIERLNKLDKQVEELLSGVQGAKIVTSHPAFEYLARDYGIEIVASLGQEPGEMPRTRDMARLVDDVRDMDIRALFVEKAYSERAAEVLARETGIAIYALDSLTSGDMDEEAYERGILADAQTLKEALENADA